VDNRKEFQGMRKQWRMKQSLPLQNKILTKDLINKAQKLTLRTWQYYWDSMPNNNKLRNIKKQY